LPRRPRVTGFREQAPNSIAPTPLAPEPTNGQETIAVTLTAIGEKLAESVRKEVVQLNLMEAKVHLPDRRYRARFKAGKLHLPWKTIRSWIKGPGLPSHRRRMARCLNCL